MAKSLQYTTVMHDGKFGADYMGVMLGPTIIAQVPYQGDGSQRDVAERLVKGWNELDVVTEERDALAAVGPQMQLGARKRTEVIEMLIGELGDIRDKLEPGMKPEEIATILVQINKAIRLARARAGTPTNGGGK